MMIIQQYQISVQLLTPLLLNLCSIDYQELNISVHVEDFVNIDNDIVTSASLSSADILGLCMPSTSSTDFQIKTQMRMIVGCKCNQFHSQKF
jgi:hypothetical protein